ncbi:MAG: glycosyltransferase family 2 protein [Cyclobacteriaceae bacterium]
MIFWIEILVFTYFLWVVLYNLFLSIAALFYRNPKFLKTVTSPQPLNRIAVFIPSYKEDSVIVNVAKHALKQDYPKSKYDVIVIADSLKESTIKELNELNITLHVVQFEKSTKVKSLNSALALSDDYEIAVILDADNVMESRFLSIIDQCFQNGWRAIQGRRVAKNLNTSFAVLDGLSEAINNHIFRQGCAALGLSSPIIGSGMAYEYSTLKKVMKSMDAVGGFDKVLQAVLLQMRIKIYYVKQGIVFDEKVENSDVFKNQRTRWISSHYIYLRKLFLTGVESLFKGQLSLFNITVLMSFQLPRILNIGILFIISISVLLLSNYTTIPFYYWAGCLFFYLTGIALAIPSSYYNRKLFSAVIQLPRAFCSMLAAHLKLKNANKKFIHTPHKH